MSTRTYTITLRVEVTRCLLREDEIDKTPLTTGEKRDIGHFHMMGPVCQVNRLVTAGTVAQKTEVGSVGMDVGATAMVVRIGDVINGINYHVSALDLWKAVKTGVELNEAIDKS